MLIETDILLALISPMDRRHDQTISLMDKYAGKFRLSPYSLIELNLLLRSEEIIVEDVTAFYEALSELLKYRMIDTYPTKPEYHNEAYRLRNKYKALTYFDSLHAAVALVESQELVSYDKRYTEITELKHTHPDELKSKPR